MFVFFLILMNEFPNNSEKNLVLSAIPEVLLLNTLSSVTLHSTEGGENFDKSGSNGTLTGLVVQVQGLLLKGLNVGELTFDGDDTGGILGEFVLEESVGDGIGGVEVVEVADGFFFVAEKGVGEGVVFLILFAGGGGGDVLHELLKVGDADDGLALNTSGQEAGVHDFHALDFRNFKGVCVDVGTEGEGERSLHVVDNTAVELVGEELRQRVATLLPDGHELDDAALIIIACLDDGFNVFVGVGVEGTTATTVGGDGDEELDLLGGGGREEGVFVVVGDLEALFGVAHGHITGLGAADSLAVFGQSNHLDGLDDLVELLVAFKLFLVDTELTRHISSCCFLFFLINYVFFCSFK